MRDLIEFASANHASRIAKRPDEDVSDEEMITLTAADIRLGCEELLARMV